MKKIFLPYYVFSTLTTFANEATNQGLDYQINEVFAKYTGWFVNAIFYQIPITEDAGIPWVVILLLGFATFFTFYFKFINLGAFATAINVVRGKYDAIDDHSNQEDVNVLEVDHDIKGTIKDESQEGEVSHFQALTAALSGTVGLGNIAGIAIAITIGGPGALSG